MKFVVNKQEIDATKIIQEPARGVREKHQKSCEFITSCHMRTFFTIDVEQDCPPFRSSYRGIEEGLPKLIEIFKQKNVLATFFVTGDVARRYPTIIEKMVEAGHEIGCHGDTHTRFDKMNYQQAEAEIRSATETLRQFYPVVSFRAPNLQLPGKYLGILSENGYQIDSSEARHKKPWLKVRTELGILRVPISTTSLVLRLSPTLRNLFLRQMRDPVVLFVHPWEFVDLRQENLRFDCRWRTGAYSLNALAETIDFFQKKEASFQPLLSSHGNVPSGHQGTRPCKPYKFP